MYPSSSTQISSDTDTISLHSLAWQVSDENVYIKRLFDLLSFILFKQQLYTFVQTDSDKYHVPLPLDNRRTARKKMAMLFYLQSLSILAPSPAIKITAHPARCSYTARK